MTTTERSTVVGVFEYHGQAIKAVEELRQAGFLEDQLGTIARKGDVSENAPLAEGDTGTKMEEAAAGGVVTGAALGGVLGALATVLVPGVGPAIAAGILVATLGGAAAGAVTGGLLGALIGMGVPEDEARVYEREFLTGRTLVTVRAGPRYADAIAILRRHGAQDTSAPSLAVPANLP